MILQQSSFALDHLEYIFSFSSAGGYGNLIHIKGVKSIRVSVLLDSRDLQLQEQKFFS
jgi:hypothetical protein